MKIQFGLWLLVIVCIACNDESVDVYTDLDTQTDQHHEETRDEVFSNDEMKVVERDAQTVESQLEQLDTVDSSGEQADEAQLRSHDNIYYNFYPYQSCPSEQSLIFMVKDYNASPQFAVRFISPTGNEYFIPMYRTGHYQYVFVLLHTQGRWDWEYVYAGSHQPAEDLDELYYRDMTGVIYGSGSEHASIYFPFTSSDGWVMTCGHGCGAHTHQYNEYYAQDWANIGTTLGEDFISPLDGYVAKTGFASTSYGNYVYIEQEIGDALLEFRIAHLSTIAVSEGDRVIAGTTKLGEVGSSGNSTGPHAHCVLFDITSGRDNISFDFSGSCD